jgi:hypothetical protein
MNEVTTLAAVFGLILTLVAGRDLYRTFQNLRLTRERQNRQIVIKQIAATESICECPHYASPSVDQKSVSFWAF